MTIHGIQPGNRPFEYLVPSEQDPMLIYHVYMDIKKCTCKGFTAHHSCKHLEIWVPEYIRQMEGGREPEEHVADVSDMIPEPSTNGIHKEGGMLVPPPSTPVPTKWVKRIHGKDFITYEGLLAMAHEQGLQTLCAEFIKVTETLALAEATAKFKDGRIFGEAADATPTNVHAQVKAHFPRVALTRAKARVLRDALNIGMIAVEELEE